ncbi:MAG: HD domain-containing phosphohydrolase [Vicinamibacterales bacterium]
MSNVPGDISVGARRADRLFGGSNRMNLLLTSAQILVMDDEEPNVRLLASMLRRAGFHRVSSLTDSRQLEARLAQVEPDLVVLDLHMPHRDGFEVLGALEPWILGEHLPVLVITGDISLDSRRRALELGARDFVTKPFDVTEVSLRVRNLLETRLLYQDVRKQNRALLESIHGTAQELQETRLEMLERLAVAAEYRDDSTSRHTERVGEMTAWLADAIGLGAQEQALLRRAAALHDVGKIGIPDALLRKPGGLTAEETQVMRSHTTIGAHILGGSQAPLLQLAELIALTHHERWDGTGYPNRIVGEQIPLPGRLVAVADAFDALTNDRPYRRAVSVNEALHEIAKQRAVQFDADIVDALLSVVPRLTLPPTLAIQ